MSLRLSVVKISDPNHRKLSECAIFVDTERSRLLCETSRVTSIKKNLWVTWCSQTWNSADFQIIFVSCCMWWIQYQSSRKTSSKKFVWKQCWLNRFCKICARKWFLQGHVSLPLDPFLCIPPRFPEFCSRRFLETSASLARHNQELECT